MPAFVREVTVHHVINNAEAEIGHAAALHAFLQIVKGKPYSRREVGEVPKCPLQPIEILAGPLRQAVANGIVVGQLTDHVTQIGYKALYRGGDRLAVALDFPAEASLEFTLRSATIILQFPQILVASHCAAFPAIPARAAAAMVKAAVSAGEPERESQKVSNFRLKGESHHVISWSTASSNASAGASSSSRISTVSAALKGPLEPFCGAVASGRRYEVRVERESNCP